MAKPKRFTRDFSTCKYCGADLPDYREFCNHFCKSDFNEDRADHYFDAWREQEERFK